MRRVSTMRRAAGALAIAVGALAMTGSGAQAAGSLPEILNGESNAQALHIHLSLPSLDQLQATLAEVGVDTSAVDLPDLPVDLAQEIDIVVSKTGGVVIRADESVPDGARGFATTVDSTGLAVIDDGGALDLNESVSTACKRSACSAAEAIPGRHIDLPLGLGTVDVANGTSKTKSFADTRNAANLAKVHLASIADGPLAALGAQFDLLSETLNDSVFPVVNDVLETVDATLREALEGEAEEVIDAIFTEIGRPEGFEKIDLRSEDLLDLTILGAKSNVAPYTEGGRRGLKAVASSGVADINILGNWATVDAATVEALSKANGTRAGSDADSVAKVAGVNVGQALGVDLNLGFFADPDNIKDAIEAQLGQDLPSEAGQVIDELKSAVDLLYNIAGLSVKYPKEYSKVDPSGAYAWAEAGATPFTITVEPHLPKLDALLENLPSADAIVPRLDDEDYVSTGVVLKIELPKADTKVAIGDVKDVVFTRPPRTGVPVVWLAGLAMLAGAVIVRRFALR